MTTPSKEKIAERAYEIWQDLDCPAGRDQEIWFEAECQLTGKPKPDPVAPPVRATAPRKIQSA